MTDARLLGNISMIEGHLAKLMRVQQRAQQVAEYRFLNQVPSLSVGQRGRLVELRKHLWPEGDGS